MNARGRPSAWYFQRTRSSLFTLISITRRCLLFWGCGVASALQSSHADGGKITKKLLICIRPDSEGGGFWRTNGRSGCGSDFCLAAAASLAVDFPAENVTSVDGARINVEARLGHLKRETTEWPTAVTNSFNPPGRKKEPAVGISRLICRFSFIYTISTLKAFPVIESLHLPLERATPSLCGPGTFFSFFFSGSWKLRVGLLLRPISILNFLKIRRPGWPLAAAFAYLQRRSMQIDTVHFLERYEPPVKSEAVDGHGTWR